MNNESFVFYESVYKQMQVLEKRLGPETALRFMNAVIEFGLYGVVPEEDSDIFLYGFEQTITSISAAKDRRQKQIENGKKGGRPKFVEDEKIIELIQQGKTNAQIAEELGYSLSSVNKKSALYRKVSLSKTVNTVNNLNNNENANVNENENVVATCGRNDPPPTPPSTFDLNF